MSTQRRSADPDEVRQMVREGYTRVVLESSREVLPHASEVGRRIGYEQTQLDAVPEGANLGLGCGNPTAIDALRPGETVLDLGSGAGMDAFLAARQVGPGGSVIGVDMTDAMLDRARENAAKIGATNVEFRKGQIEQLPIEDESIDAVISNCVVNLSPEKARVFSEAFRVLRPGGRLMISDLVLERPLPPELMSTVEAYLGCVGGASLRAPYLETVAKAGFREVRVERETRFADAVSVDDPQVREAMDRFGVSVDQVREFLGAVTSLHLFARK